MMPRYAADYALTHRCQHSKIQEILEEKRVTSKIFETKESWKEEISGRERASIVHASVE